MELPFHVDLSGRVAVITGGAGVLGRMMAEVLAGAGASVAIVDLNKDRAEECAAQLAAKNLRVRGYNADVLNTESVQQANEIIQRDLGICDILINAAGGNHPDATTSFDYHPVEQVDLDAKTFFDLKPESINFVFNLNFLGTFIPSQVFAKHMIGSTKHPVIINISSMNAYRPLTRIPAYSAAKAAVSNFTQWLAVHFSRVGIRVNAIAPGFFETEQNRHLLRNVDGSLSERAKKIIDQTPLKRFGNPEELAGTLLWLVDHRASGFVTGIVVPVDGGFLAYSGV